MKPTKRTDIEHISNLKGKKTALSVDVESLNVVMQTLSELYEDPELAVLREYSTNAWDSHQEAGQTRPIEVTLPSALDQFLRIKDFGVGLSEWEIENVYSKYGASTKRDTNKQGGKFGLGCKSAFAYSDQFTVVAIKDGMCARVSISRDENMAGTVTVDPPFPTTEPNGVTVVIPTLKHNDFDSIAEEFFSYWPEGSVLVNGKPPKRFEGMKVTDDLYVIEGYQDKVVMANVSYDVTFNKPMKSGRSLVAFVPIGSLEIPPARERLILTPETKAFIAETEKQFADKMVGAVREYVGESEDKFQAVRRLQEWRQVIPKVNLSSVKFDGVDVPLNIKDKSFIDQKRDTYVTRVRAHNYNAKKDHENYSSVSLMDSDQTIYFTGYTQHTFTAYTRNKIEQWMANKGIDPDDVVKYVLFPTEPGHDWHSAQVYPWEEVKKTKMPRNGRTSDGRIAGSYDMVIDGVFKAGVPASDIDLNKALFHYEGKYEGNTSYWQRGYESDYRQVIEKEHDKDYTVVYMNSNRINKFKRLFPESVELRYEAHEIGKRICKAIDDDVRLAHQHKYLISAVAALDLDRIDDPMVTEFAKLDSIDTSEVTRVREDFRKLIDVDEYLKADQELANISERYPGIISHDLRQHPEHLYLYMNAAYHALYADKEEALSVV